MGLKLDWSDLKALYSGKGGKERRERRYERGGNYADGKENGMRRSRGAHNRSISPTESLG